MLENFLIFQILEMYINTVPRMIFVLVAANTISQLNAVELTLEVAPGKEECFFEKIEVIVKSL